MEEFVENFCEFREWLNDLSALNPEEMKLITKIQTKFEDLGLNNVFKQK